MRVQQERNAARGARPGFLQNSFEVSMRSGNEQIASRIHN
jgi:hypothetical protein